MNLIVAELRREYFVWWHHRVGEISTLLMATFIFVLLMVLFNVVAVEYGNGYGYDSSDQLNSLLGFLTWYLCFGILEALPNMISNEMHNNLFEKLVALPPNFILFRGTSLLVKQVIYTGILAVIIGLFFQLSLPYQPSIVLVVFITVFGSFFIGLAFAGVVIVKKRINNLLALISYIALLATGALVPLDDLGIAFNAIKFLLPTSLSIDMIRALSSGYSLSDLRSSFIILIVQNSIFMFLGVFLWTRYIHIAKRDGELSQY